ncbi:MAG: head GIN domain-containing protein [Bacteroidota bacterium]
MKTLLRTTMVLTLLALCAPALLAQTIEKRRVGDFTGVSIGGIFKVEITQGRSSSLEIEACPDAMDHINTTVRDGILHVGLDDYDGDCNAILHITVGKFDYLSLSGVVNLHTTNTVRQREMHLLMSGATKLNGDWNIESLHLEASGAANMNMAGKTEEAKVEMSGAAKLSASDFIAKEMIIEASGAANARVHVIEELDAELSGAANVNYKGDPEVRKELSGMANVNRG